MNNNTEEQVGGSQVPPGPAQIDFESIPRTALSVVLDPVSFYKDMKRTGGFIEPLVFMIVLSVIAGAISALMSMFGLGISGLMVGGLIAIVLVPIYVGIFSFIGAGIAYGVWKLMGSQEDFETAFRCIAYTAAIAPINALLAVVPYLGSVISALWPMALLAIASIHVHRRSANLAWGVFGALGLLLALSSISGEHKSRELASELADLQEMLDESRR